MIMVWRRNIFCAYFLFYLKIQSNLAIRNFLFALRLFLNAKSSLSLWSKCQIDRRKWFLNTNLFLIKPLHIAKFDCRRIFYVWNDFTFKKLHNPTYEVIISYMYIVRYELMKTELFNSMYVPICMSDRSKAIGYIILIG